MWWWLCWLQCSYLRKRLTIVLREQVRGRSVSAGFWQITSTVTDELNKLRRANHVLSSLSGIYLCSFSCMQSKKKVIQILKVNLCKCPEEVVYCFILFFFLPEECGIQVARINMTLYPLHSSHQQRQHLWLRDWRCILLWVVKWRNWKEQKQMLLHNNLQHFIISMDTLNLRNSWVQLRGILVFKDDD